MSDAGSSPTRMVASPIGPPSWATSSFTSLRMRSASARPSMIVAAIEARRLPRRENRPVKRWPRKNDPGSIRERQELLGLDGEVVGFDLEPWVKAAEQLTGAAVIPVSVAGALPISLGEYVLDDAGAVVE